MTRGTNAGRRARWAVPTLLFIVAVTAAFGVGRLLGPNSVALWVQILTGFIGVPPLIWQIRGLLTSGRSGPDAGRVSDLRSAVLRVARSESKRLELDAPMPIRWRLVPDLLPARYARPGRRTGQNPLLRTRSDLAGLFRRLPHQRLVIVGEEGSGKSAAALMLTFGLLETWREGQPVPITISLATWRSGDRASLAGWMADQINDKVQLQAGPTSSSRDVALRLIEEGKVLPVLEGLDELPDGEPAKLLQRLDMDLDNHDGFILTSRTEQYRHAAAHAPALPQTTVIELLEPDLRGVERFLVAKTASGQQGRWNPVLDQLRTKPGSPLAVVLRSPLMVFLTRYIYTFASRDPVALLDPRLVTPEDIEYHLLDELIPALYRGDRIKDGTQAASATQWTVKEVRDYLTFFARSADRTMRDIGWWQLEYDAPAIVSNLPAALVAAAVVGYTFGPAIGAAFAVLTLGIGAFRASRSWTVEALAARVAPKLFAAPEQRGLIARAVTSLLGWDEPTPVERRAGLAVGRLSGLVAGILRGLTVWRAHGGVFLSVADGLAVGLTVGLATGFFTISIRETPSEVEFGFRRGAAACLRHLCVGVMTGIASGVMVWVIFHSRFGVLVCLIVGVSFGFIDGMNVWLDVNADVTRARSARSTRISERWAAIARSSTVAVVVGVTIAIAFALASGAAAAVAAGLIFGAGYGLADRYVGIVVSVWGRYAAAKIWLAASGRIPWRLMKFLHDTHGTGLLRSSGAAYRFRHDSLRHHLVAAGSGENVA